jgi:hypothetical protein
MSLGFPAPAVDVWSCVRQLVRVEVEVREPQMREVKGVRKKLWLARKGSCCEVYWKILYEWSGRHETQ